MQNIAQISHKSRTSTFRPSETQTNTRLPKRPSTDSRKLYIKNTNTYPLAQNHLDDLDPALKTLKINKKNQEYLIKGNDYKICLVDSLEQQTNISQFVKKKYASKGYLTETASDLSYNPNQITFEASNDQYIFGTLTLTIGSCDDLMVNTLYAKEMSTFRKKGRKICELSKFASSPHCSSKKIFASLFHLAHIYAHIIHKTEDAFIEINPRHAFFYKRMLGFHQIGEERTCERVNAPAILLHLDLDYMSSQITALACQSAHNSKTIYPYFLSQHEEKRLTNKLQKSLFEQSFYSHELNTTQLSHII